MPRQSRRMGSLLLDHAVKALVVIAALCLLAMIGLIVVDTVLGNLFGMRIFGAYEIVGLLMAPVAFLPMARTLLKGGHLTVEIVDSLASVKVIHALRVLGLAGVVIFTTMLAVFMFTPMADAIRFGDATPDRGIPAIVKLAPIFIAFCAAAICACVLLVSEFRTVARARRGEP